MSRWRARSCRSPEIRFTAGVTSNLEVIQAQTAVSTATDTEISGAYAFNVAKAALVRALGAAIAP